MTEAQVKEIAQKAIEEYFTGLAKKNTSDWADDAVNYVKEKGYMNGDADGNFRPQSPITRQEVAATIKNILDK